MADNLVSELKALLISELQAKGYVPNASDVHPLAMKVIDLIEREKAAVEAVVNDKVAKLEAQIAKVATPAPVTPAPVTPVTPATPAAPTAIGVGPVTSVPTAGGVPHP